MKSGYINLVDLDFEYKIWKLRLEYFLSEISILKDRNEEVKGESNINELPTEELKKIENHFDSLKQLFSRIKVQEQELHFYNKDFPITAKHQFYTDHKLIGERVEDVSKRHSDFFTQLMRDLTIKLK